MKVPTLYFSMICFSFFTPLYDHYTKKTLEIIKTNIVPKFHGDKVMNVACNAHKVFQQFDLVTYFYIT